MPHDTPQDSPRDPSRDGTPDTPDPAKDTDTRAPRHAIESPVDLDFRPKRYTDFDDPVSLALNGIAGQRRREMVRDILTAEGEKRERLDELLGPIHPDILRERASRDFASSMTRMAGPTWMGGEYLPPLLPGEVEIARIVLQSTTMDVAAVRARREEGRYHYRMVDEYDTDFEVSPEVSAEPLTLGELIDLLEGADAVIPWWEQQFGFGDPPEACTDFATVESDLYPGLAIWYEARAAEWRKGRGHEPPPLDSFSQLLLE
jgi:hypothetical protein